MKIIDTHTHLYLKDFKKDFDDVIKRAIKNGVSKFLFPAINSTFSQEMLNLQKKYPKNIKLMTGLHPSYVNENYKYELDLVSKSLNNHNYIAIGEIGIDLYRDKTFLQQQQDSFLFQVRLALSKNLPIVIHCRDSFDEVFEILESESCSLMRGVFHCFTGTLTQANRAINLGFKLGIGGVVTFKNAGLDQLINKIELDNIVLETDSPYLAPVPHRGKRNESAYLLNILNKLSEIYFIEKKIIADITYKNSKRLFNL